MTRLYCPNCETARVVGSFSDGPHACNECGSMLLERPEWPLRARVTHRVRQATFYAVAGVFVLGPPAWVVWEFVTALLNGAPLVTVGTATATRTTTEIGGALGQLHNSGAMAVLPIWALVMMIILTMPITPRRI